MTAREVEEEGAGSGGLRKKQRRSPPCSSLVAALVGWTTGSRGGTGWLGVETEEERGRLWLVVLDREGDPKEKETWAGGDARDKLPRI